MNFSSDFEIPPAPEPVGKITEEQALDKAFYAAGAYGEDVVEEFYKITNELSVSNTSLTLENAQKRWEQEQDEVIKGTVLDLISDNTIPIEERRKIVSTYASSGFVSKDLKDKFIQRVVSTDSSKTFEEKQSQDLLINGIPDQLKVLDNTEMSDAILRTETTFPEYFGGGAAAAFEIAKAIPTGIWGMLVMLKEKDAVAGKEAAEDLMSGWGTTYDNKNITEVRDTLLEKLSILGVPARNISNWLYDNTGSAGFSIVGGVALDPLNLPFLVGARYLSLSRKGYPSVSNGSRVDVLTKTNPPIAAEIITSALKESSDEAFKALGTDQAALLSAYSLPKFGPELKHFPDITTRILEKDKEVAAVIAEQFYDPNLQNASKRIEENQRVYEIVNNHGFHYNQAMSIVTPTRTNLWEGKAYFTKDGNYPFYSRSDTVATFKQIENSINSLDSSLRGSLSIEDINTGKRYTPEQLLKEEQFKTREEMMREIPTEYKGIPVRVGKVYDENGKTLLDENGKSILGHNFGKEIVLDVDEIKKRWESKSDAFKEKFNTPDEFVQFVLQHELAHTDFPSIDGLTGKDYENKIHQIAYDRFTEKFKNIPNTRNIKEKQFAVVWEWKKEYDDIKASLFGINSIKGDFLGIDVSRLARSSLGRHIFGPGRFPEWFEKSAARIAPRAAREMAVLLNIARESIATTRHRKELNELINEGERLGKEYFSIVDLQKRFPNLNSKQVENLLETHTYWRRINHYLHTLVNIKHRDDLLSEGFNRGLQVFDPSTDTFKYTGPVTPDFTFKPGEIKPVDVWDYDLNTKIKFKQDESKTEGVFDVGGKQLVRHKNPFPDEDGNIYQYSLIGGTKSKIDLLPEQVVPRIPGYSPIKQEAHFFVDVIPSQLTVNGLLVSDPTTLKNYRQTKGAAQSEFDADRLRKEFENDPEYAGYVVEVRADRSQSFGRIMSDYEAHDNLLRNAQQRGEALKTINNGVAPIEDRLTTLANTIQSLSTQGKFDVWERSTKEVFVASYKEFLPNGEFPTKIDDIRPSSSLISREDSIRLQEAREIYKHYSKLKSFETWGDTQWKNILTGIADVVESFKVPAGLIRDLAKKPNLLVEVPRKIASLAYITLNPQRQWLIQPAQLLEYYAIHPTTALTSMAQLSAVRLALMSEAPILKGAGSGYFDAAKKLAVGMDEKEFLDTVNAIKQSGLMESIDLNMLVHDVFDNMDRGLLETGWEKAFNNTVAIPKAVTKVSRKVGFDFAETNNRLGLWILAKNRWIEQNPGKKWNTKEAIEDISYEEWRLSGSMTRAGSYPYQSGAAAILLQFAAITQKQTMNLFSASATKLSTGERLRLAFARASMWGAYYGSPGGPLVYHFLDQNENEEVQKYANILRVGIFDRAFSNLVATLYNEEPPTLLASRGMTPYNDVTGLGIAYIDFMVTAYEFYKKGKEGARFPAVAAVGGIGETLREMESWFTVGELTPETAKNVLYEALEFASGFNNANKALLMYTTGQKRSKSGTLILDDVTKAEAFAQIFGVVPQREMLAFEVNASFKNRKERLDDLAKDVHKQLVNQHLKDGLGDDIVAYRTRLKRMNSLITMLVDNGTLTEGDAEYIGNKIFEFERFEATEMGSSLLSRFLDQVNGNYSNELIKADNYLRQINKNDPKTIELLDYVKGKNNG